MNYYNYFTEIEEHFVRRRGKHVLISPMDWSLIATWRGSGIPLHVALRGIDIAMDGFFARPQRPGKVNSLFYCHDTVMEEFARYLESRVGEAAPEALPESSPSGSQSGEKPSAAFESDRVLQFLSARISEINSAMAKLFTSQGSAAPEGLQRIRARLEELMGSLAEERRFDPESMERDLGILEEILVAELRQQVEPGDEARWMEEAKRELKVYRKRLPKETYQKILANYINGRIHRKFDIGELSLFHL